MVTELPDARADGHTTTRLVYGDCEGGAEVQLLRVEDGGHTWPGGAIDLGGTTYDFSASQEVWDFLSRFSRAGATGASDVRAGGGERLDVWPNPVLRGGQLSLKPVARARRLELSDATGRVVRRLDVPAGATAVELGDVAAGTYLLVGEAGGPKVRLVVVQ